MSKTARTSRNNPTTTAAAELAIDLGYSVGENFTAEATERGWVEIRINPAHALHGTNKAGRAVDARGTECDFIRVVQEEAGEPFFNLYHLTHNEVIKGEARLSNSLAGLLGAFVGEFCETAF
jgi:hypothetical protein